MRKQKYLYYHIVSHKDVVNIVQLVNKHNIVIIPFGGGTSVSGAVSCPENEKRCIVTVDTTQMVIIY